MRQFPESVLTSQVSVPYNHSDTHSLIMKLPKPCQEFRLKYLKSHKHNCIPSYGAFAAFSSLRQWLYPQYTTWYRESWRPEPTLKSKLIPWYIFSLVLFSVNLSFFYIGIREILAYSKDPEMSSAQVLLLVYCIFGACCASSVVLTYILEEDGFRFVLRNLEADVNGNSNMFRLSERNLY